jgi:peptide deformylase
MHYEVIVSDDEKYWELIDYASSRERAIEKLNYYMDKNTYRYIKIKEKPHELVIRFMKKPFVWISNMLSYTSRPVTAKELCGVDKKDDLYNLNDFSTHISRETRFLVATMFPVIMRLFKSSGTYKKLILDSLDYMMELTTRQYRDYPEVRGISGANVGIPFNLVVVKVCKIGKEVPEDLRKSTIKYKGYHFLHMINPKIDDQSMETFKTTTNCGSLRLERDINVTRYKWVWVTFYDRKGDKCKRLIARPITGTVQHEIDHNNGTLITDREVKNKE